MTEGEKQVFELFGGVFVGVLITVVMALPSYVDELTLKKEIIKKPVVIERTESEQVFNEQFKEHDRLKEAFRKELKKTTDSIKSFFNLDK